MSESVSKVISLSMSGSDLHNMKVAYMYWILNGLVLEQTFPKLWLQSWTIFMAKLEIQTQLPIFTVTPVLALSSLSLNAVKILKRKIEIVQDIIFHANSYCKLQFAIMLQRCNRWCKLTWKLFSVSFSGCYNISFLFFRILSLRIRFESNL